MNDSTKQTLIICVMLAVVASLTMWGWGPNLAHATEGHPPLLDTFDHVQARKGDARSFSLGCDIGDGPKFPILANIR